MTDKRTMITGGTFPCTHRSVILTCASTITPMIDVVVRQKDHSRTLTRQVRACLIEGNITIRKQQRVKCSAKEEWLESTCSSANNCSEKENNT